MGGVVKGIGKVIGAPVAGIGHALRTSGIPLVSGLGGTVENAGKGFEGKAPFLKSVLPAGALALGGLGLAGEGPLSGLLGGAGSKLGDFATTIGKALPIGLHGGQALDIGKLASGGLGLSSLMGAEQQRKSAQNYNNAEIQQRNQLMNSIMGGMGAGMGATPTMGAPAYNPTGPNITPKGKNVATDPRSVNLNQQSSATSAGY